MGRVLLLIAVTGATGKGHVVGWEGGVKIVGLALCCFKESRVAEQSMFNPKGRGSSVTFLSVHLTQAYRFFKRRTILNHENSACSENILNE